MYAFYDLETTGTSAAFDHPLQFAAIRTDENFQIIDSFELKCRLSPHVLPSPWALAITNISIETLFDTRLPNWFQFSRMIFDLVEKWTPSTWIGYNNISFDEEMLRQSFYQNLLPSNFPTQINGNDRQDIMKMLFVIYANAPSSIKWPTLASGRTSFKLDLIAPHNGMLNHKAHDALGDVKATIHLAEKIKSKAPEIWSELEKNRNKKHVNSLLETGFPVRLTLRGGSAPPRSTIGLFCGRNSDNPNQVALLDLQAPNVLDILNFSDEELLSAMLMTPKKIHIVSVNSSPSILPAADLDSELLSLASAIWSDAEFRRRVGVLMPKMYESKKQSDFFEERIYDGFYDSNDRRILNEFQSASWVNRASLVNQFEDSRLVQLGGRLICQYGAEEPVADKKMLEENSKLHKRRYSEDPNVPWMTYDKALGQFEKLRSSDILTSVKLRELENHYLNKTF